MTARRPPSQPPVLPGFTYQGLLGSGGFADVFLYDQHLPERRVAVKVLLTERLSRGSADAFTAEANMMARLSTHPAIVTIYQAGVSGDGRPYLVMENCSKPNLQVRYRKQPFSVAEALRVGVQVASAVETAHRAGILHRDIKPANILVTEYNRPALTDFGISVAVGAGNESEGMSIPWSPPEVLSGDAASGTAADVYALGATVYSLLAGRTPFEVPGQRNTSAELMQRIETLPLPRIDRADMPDALQQVLARSMAKRPADRYASALAFARALQRVQAELHLGTTPIDVLDDAVDVGVEENEDDGLTRIRAIVSIDPNVPPLPDTTQGRTVRRGEVHGGAVTAVPVDVPDFTFGAGDTITRPPASAVHAVGDAPVTVDVPNTRRSRVPVLATIAGVVVLGGAAAVWAISGGSLGEPATRPQQESQAPVPVDNVLPGQTVPLVTELTGSVEGDDAVFTWRNPDPRDGDLYLWGVQRLGEETALQSTAETSVAVPVEPGGTTCVEVTLRRGNGSTSAEPTVECTP